MEKAREFHYPLYICFIDLRKGYDSINREALWSILQSSYHLPTKLVSIIQVVHDGSRARRVSESFDVTCGVRQGCVFWHQHFLICILTLPSICHWAVTMCRTKVLELPAFTMPNVWGTVGNSCHDLEYAKDMTLFADFWNDLDAMLTTLSTHCSAFGLSISCSKTKTMAVHQASLYAQPIPIHLFPNHPPVEPVSSFQYLRSVIQEDCGSDLEVSSRICKAS